MEKHEGWVLEDMGDENEVGNVGIMGVGIKDDGECA